LLNDPADAQAYNRYSYAHNNPMKYTDRDGNNPLLIAIGVGMAISAITNIIQQGVQSNWRYKNFDVGSFLQSTIIGGVSGAITFGIGSAVSSLGLSTIESSLQSALAHGSAQGALSAIQGGDFTHAFVTGYLSSLAGSGWSEAFGGDPASMIAYSAISGGVIEEAQGGDFIKGFAMGLTIGALNHAMHGGFAKKFDITVLEDYEAASHMGHQAVAFELENGNQLYISKDGTNSNLGSVGTPKVSNNYEYSSFEEINETYSHYHEGKRYDIAAVYKATRAQINNAINRAQKIASSTYVLIGNSCMDVARYALISAFGNRIANYSVGHIPNISFFCISNS
jgi:hypothetical protein